MPTTDTQIRPKAPKMQQTQHSALIATSSGNAGCSSNTKAKPTSPAIRHRRRKLKIQELEPPTTSHHASHQTGQSSSLPASKKRLEESPSAQIESSLAAVSGPCAFTPRHSPRYELAPSVASYLAQDSATDPWSSAISTEEASSVTARIRQKDRAKGVSATVDNAMQELQAYLKELENAKNADWL